MHKQFELLAPGGGVDSIKAAIAAGADAIYCGLDNFNARNRAVNLTFDELTGVLKLAHQHHCQVFLTLNIIILEHEIPALLRLLNKLVNSKIDGVIVQDLGLFYLLAKHFKTLDIHASTQVTTHNEGQILFFKKQGASRVNLCRELNIDEIKSVTQFAHQHNMLTEVFVHGSYCISFSGLCYMSSVEGNSGNRGRCSQPCRDQYQTTASGNDYPLNLKDNSAFSDLQLLGDAGADSLKIEGRIKGPTYVYTVVNSWRKQLQRYAQGAALADSDDALYKVFNRDFSDAFLQGKIDKAMFVDSPRDHGLTHIKQKNSGKSVEQIELAKQAFFDEKRVMDRYVQDKIKDLSIAKTPLNITVSGMENSLLKVSVSTPEHDFVEHSQSTLCKAETANIDFSALEKRFKSLNNAEYTVEKLIVDELQSGLYIPFKELTEIKNRIVFLLNDSTELIAPVELPVLAKQKCSEKKARLAVLIASEKDIALCQDTGADFYYKLPEGFKKESVKLLKLFADNRQLIPWFPSILIADDYLAAVEFLKLLQPKRIVTNNSGIAYQAYRNGIDWIAGPYLNISNSYSLLAINEKFNAYGAFISNELNKKQISNIRRPGNFKLYYSIYHPLLLMLSRQCIFQQTVGCKKPQMDERCIQKCHKSASIINLKGSAFVIDKQQGGYPCLYSDKPFLNTEIVDELPGFFDALFIDLTDIGSADNILHDKAGIIRLFADLLAGQSDAQKQLGELIAASTNSQYKKGL
jgi:putative protease